MAEALSRSEVESLLSALNPGQTPARGADVESPLTPGQHVNSSELARRVVQLFEQLRHAMTSATEQMLPEPVRLKRHMPARLPLSELQNRMGEQSLLLLVESEQSGGDLLVVLDRQFAIQVVSCMLGQGTQAAEFSDSEPRDSLSPIERRLLLRWLKESLEGVADPVHWKPVEFEFIRTERDLEAYHTQAPWWCEIWELKAEHLRGRIEICGQWEFFSTLNDHTPVEETKPPSDPETNESPQSDELSDLEGSA